MTTISPTPRVAFDASGDEWAVTVEKVASGWTVRVETAYALISANEALAFASALTTASVVCRELRSDEPRTVANVGELAYRLGVDPTELLTDVEGARS